MPRPCPPPRRRVKGRRSGYVKDDFGDAQGAGLAVSALPSSVDNGFHVTPGVVPGREPGGGGVQMLQMSAQAGHTV